MKFEVIEEFGELFFFKFEVIEEFGELCFLKFEVIEAGWAGVRDYVLFGLGKLLLGHYLR